jgi:uncharacterized protein (UPF0333 family)
MFFFKTKQMRILKSSTGSVLIISTFSMCLFLMVVLSNIASITIMFPGSTVPSNAHQTYNTENESFNLISDYANDDTLLLEDCSLGNIQYCLKQYILILFVY